MTKKKRHPDPSLEAAGVFKLRSGTLEAATRNHLGAQLRAFYGSIMNDAPPSGLLDLIARVEAAMTERTSAEAEAFRCGLLNALPALRAFALALTANTAQADDLVQETMLKAWAKQRQFIQGTNLNAWLCTILRNQFYSEMRKRKREVEDADGVAASQMTALPHQEHNADLQRVWGKMALLPALQREALLLVGAQGMTYEAAADVIGCQTGTVKSRVSRARAALAQSLT